MSSVNLEPQDLPDPVHTNHGVTLAGVVMNSGLVLAAIVVAVGIAFDRPVVTAIGGSLIVLSLIVGGVLRALGHGQPLG